MPLTRTCSECPNPLAGKSVQAKTCSEKCRSARSRRVKRANRKVEEFAEANNAGAQEIAAIVRREAPDVITKVMKDELRPIVREALTEDVLRAVEQMLGLTPRAVELLAADLESEDSTVRQRAYTLVTKYTIGHPALLRPEDGAGAGQITVNFALPRPDDTEEVIEVESEEVRTCDSCNTEKPEHEFVAGSDRCRTCFEEQKAAVLEAFA